MATGAAPFNSAWGYKNMRGSGHFSMLRSEVRLSRREPDVFIDWWFGSAAPPAATGNSNFFLFFDSVFIVFIVSALVLF